VQLVDFGHLLGDLLPVFVRLLDAADVDGDGRLLLQVLAQLQVQNVRVSLVHTGFVHHRQAQHLLQSVRPVGLQEVLNFADRRDLVGDEWFEFGFEVDRLGFEQ